MADLAQRIPDSQLAEWVTAQRWFAAKARDVIEVTLEDALTLAEEPLLAIGLVAARFAAGTHELYQLLLGSEDGRVRFDVLDSGPHAAVLAGMLGRRAQAASASGTVAFHWSDGIPAPSPAPSVRAMAAEQSNSTVVLDDRIALKIFRRLEPGENPELEMVRFLGAREFANIAALAGWYELRGDLLTATLGIAQEYVGGGRDGWDLALDELGADPERLLGPLRELGGVVGSMHAILGSDPTDPDFAPEEPGAEALSLLTATIDEDIERLFIDLPEGEPALAPIAGRGEEIRDRLQMMSHVGTGGRLIRHHGDLHLGQTLRTGGRDPAWLILDFEGEPARPLTERRRKRSPLRDVAGMLRSFAYAASASSILRSRPAPADWEARARETFLEGYLETVDATLLPPGIRAIEGLLGIFELEKAVYELRYELDNRPDWVGIPVAGIERLLAEPIQ